MLTPGRSLTAALAALALAAAPCAACAGQPVTPPATTAPDSTEAPATAQVLILGEGPTREQADAWLKRWIEAAHFHRDLLKPARGFPKVVRSDDVPGLAPGSHVVLLGACESPQAAAPLEFVRSFFPAARASAASVPPEACPALRRRTRVAASRTIHQAGNRMVVNVYFSPASEESDPEGVARARAAGKPPPGEYRVRAAVFGADDIVYGYEPDEVFTSLRGSSCDVKLSGSDARIVLDVTWQAGEELPCSGNVSRFVTRTTYRFDGTRLDAKNVDLEKVVSKHCD